MKTTPLLVASLLLGVAPAMAAEQVNPAQLPAAVKQTLSQNAPGAAVKGITVERVSGRAIYDIELDWRHAPNAHLRIADNGQVTRDALAAPTSAAAVDYGGGDVFGTTPPLRLKFAELPKPVQATVRREAAGRDIAVITADSFAGRRAYAIQFRERGRNPWVYVGEDGTVLRPTEKPPLLGIGITLADTPPVVQQTIRREMGGGEIVGIDKDRRRREPALYHVRVKDSHGEYRLSISADGRVLENTRGRENLPNRG